MVRTAPRATTRLILTFVLDFLQAGARLAGRHDLGLLFMLAAFANVETLAPDDEGLASVPDDRLRPISANAIALELGQPRETVRRQINQLIAKGLVARVGRPGVVAPAEVSGRPEVAAAHAEVLLSFCRMARRAVETGFVWPDDGRPSAWADRPRPNLMIARPVAALALRLVRASLDISGRLEDTVLLLAVTEHNLRRITDDAALSHLYGAAAAPGPPDDLKRPARTAELVGRTGIPTPTVNRAIRRLVDAGLLQRRLGGVIASAALLESHPMRLNEDLVSGYLAAAAARLAALGVTGEDLRRWADEDDGLAPKPSAVAAQPPDREGTGHG